MPRVTGLDTTLLFLVLPLAVAPPRAPGWVD